MDTTKRLKRLELDVADRQLPPTITRFDFELSDRNADQAIALLSRPLASLNDGERSERQKILALLASRATASPDAVQHWTDDQLRTMHAKLVRIDDLARSAR